VSSMRKYLISSIPFFIAVKYALPFIEAFYLLFIRMALTIAVFLFLCAVFRVKGCQGIKEAIRWSQGF
jgi:hypothetical protein